jgi:hypothetical protein
MNDAATAADLTAQGYDGMSGAAAREVKALVVGWSSGRAAALKRELKSAWQEFRDAGKFW